MTTTTQRMCCKCGEREPRSTMATVCSKCSKLGSRAPVNPAAAQAARDYDLAHPAQRRRPDIMTHPNMRSARTAAKPPPRGDAR